MPQPLRIVYLIGQLGLGGSERQLYLLLKHMDKSRFEPHVVVFNPSANYTLDDDLQKVGVSVHAIPREVKNIRARMIWLYKLFRRLHPRVIHSWSIHDNPYAGLVGWLAGVKHRLGSVRDSLNTPDFLDFPGPVQWIILNSVQGLLVNSQEIVDELIQMGIVGRRVQMLPNCVEVEERTPPPILNMPPHARIIGLVANLRRKKNHIMFLRSMSEILPEFPDVYGLMVGQPVPASDPDIPHLIENEIANLGIGKRVRLFGFYPDVPSLLHTFEIFCLTSDFEGTPNAVLEAMAAGLPVIATRVGGLPRLVDDGVSGLLIDPGDIHGLADSLRVLLRDPTRAKQMGIAGRKRVEAEFGPETIVRQFEEYYRMQFAK